MQYMNNEAGFSTIVTITFQRNASEAGKQPSGMLGFHTNHTESTLQVNYRRGETPIY